MKTQENNTYCLSQLLILITLNNLSSHRSTFLYTHLHNISIPLIVHYQRHARQLFNLFKPLIY